MDEALSYAVFLFPQAIEVLGDAIKPYLSEGPTGAHIVCTSVDASGGFFEVSVPGRDREGNDVVAQLMLPNAFIKFVVSLHNDQSFGFSVRGA